MIKKLVVIITLIILSTVPVFADDVIVDPGVMQLTETGVIWTGLDTGYLFYKTGTGSGSDLMYTKTTDGGQNWGTPVLVTVNDSAAICEPAAFWSVWYDKWTVGDNGNLIHIAYFHNGNAPSFCGSSGTDSLRYRTLDTTTDVLGSEVVDTSPTNRAGVGQSQSTFSITKAAGGDIYVTYRIKIGGSTDNAAYKSTTGTSFTTIDKGIGGITRFGTIAPAAPFDGFVTVDENDIYAISQDGTRIEILWYQSQFDDWIVARSDDVLTGGISGNDLHNVFTRAVVPSTGQIYFGTRHANASAGIDSEATFHVVRQSSAIAPSTLFSYIASPFENRENNRSISLMYDANEDVLYAAYDDSLTDEVFYASVNNPASSISWSTEVVCNSTPDIARRVALVPALNGNGGRFFPVWETGSLQIASNLDCTQAIRPLPPPDIGGIEKLFETLLCHFGICDETGKLLFAVSFILVWSGILFAKGVHWSIVMAMSGILASGFSAIEFVPAWIILAGMVLVGMGMILKVQAGAGGDE